MLGGSRSNRVRDKERKRYSQCAEAKISNTGEERVRGCGGRAVLTHWADTGSPA